jgi:hypothetical protein
VKMAIKVPQVRPATGQPGRVSAMIRNAIRAAGVFASHELKEAL